jgi:hypothetical protein
LTTRHASTPRFPPLCEVDSNQLSPHTFCGFTVREVHAGPQLADSHLVTPWYQPRGRQPRSPAGRCLPSSLVTRYPIDISTRRCASAFAHVLSTAQSPPRTSKVSPPVPRPLLTCFQPHGYRLSASACADYVCLGLCPRAFNRTSRPCMPRASAPVMRRSLFSCFQPHMMNLGAALCVAMCTSFRSGGCNRTLTTPHPPLFPCLQHFTVIGSPCQRRPSKRSPATFLPTRIMQCQFMGSSKRASACGRQVRPSRWTHTSSRPELLIWQ